MGLFESGCSFSPLIFAVLILSWGTAKGQYQTQNQVVICLEGESVYPWVLGEMFTNSVNVVLNASEVIDVVERFDQNTLSPEARSKCPEPPPGWRVQWVALIFKDAQGVASAMEMPQFPERIIDEFTQNVVRTGIEKAYTIQGNSSSLPLGAWPPPQLTSTPPPPIAKVPPPPPPAPDGSSSDTTVIIAIAVGASVALLIIVGLVVLWKRKRVPEEGASRPGGRFGKFRLRSPPIVCDEYDGENAEQTPDDALLVVLNQHHAQPEVPNRTADGPQPAAVVSGETRESADERFNEPGTQQKEPQMNNGLSGRQNSPQILQDWNLEYKNLVVHTQIGEGSFGKVYLATHKETHVAVKVFLGAGLDIKNVAHVEAALSMSQPVMQVLAKESSMMASLRHENIVNFKGTCSNPPCIVMEFCEKGSLCDVLRAAKQSHTKTAELTWSRRLGMALDAATGMLQLHLHNPPIIHRDMKSPNLLVKKSWRVKVSDFNLSKLMEENTVMSSMAATNPRWLAPEILAGRAATFASDVYAFGIVLWELMTWELPWGPTNPWQVVTMVTEGGRCEIPPRDRLPGPDNRDFQGLDAYITLMKKCWAHNPLDRPGFAEIITRLRDLNTVIPNIQGQPVNPMAVNTAPECVSVSSTHAQTATNDIGTPSNIKTGEEYRPDNQNPTLQYIHENLVICAHCHRRVPGNKLQKDGKCGICS